MVGRVGGIEGQPKEERLVALCMDPVDGIVGSFSCSVGCYGTGNTIGYFCPVGITRQLSDEIPFKMIITHYGWIVKVGNRHRWLQVPFSNIGFGNSIGLIGIK